jgi:hypothetical protein
MRTQMSSQPTNVESPPTTAERAELEALLHHRANSCALNRGMMQELLIGRTRLV